MPFRRVFAAIFFAHGCITSPAGASAQPAADLVVFAASPGGIMAAVAAARDGASVLVVEPTKYAGGIVAQGGLVLSDLGDETTIGGLARDFFSRIDRHYTETYGANSPQREHSKFQGYPGGCFEPRVAETIFESYLREYPNIQVLREAQLTEVRKVGTRITSIRARLGDGSEREIAGKIFMDASYTGDLLAKSGVAYRVGREAQADTGESLARPRADAAIQAYNYRLTLTKDPGNRVPVAPPANYDPQDYAYMLDGILRNKPYRITNIFRPYWRLPNQKQDTNVADMAGANHDYPEADIERRREIEKRHRDYSLGYIYFLQNDERVPEEIRSAAREWGLPRDEFPDNGHFPRAIYVREARRMKGEYLMRQQDLQEERRKPDSIALGSYAIDSHAVRTYKDSDGKTKRDGYLFVPVKPYAIPYRALLPKREEVSNLLVPVTMSSTAIAWASMRMEPVFMMAGEAAGAAAAMSLKTGAALHDLDPQALRTRLSEAGAILDPPIEPIAAFSFSPDAPRPGEQVTFKYARKEGASEPRFFFWDFDGDGKTDSTEPAPVRAFEHAKSTLVSLVVADDAGKRSLPVAERVPVGGGTDGDLQLDSEDDAVRAPGTEQSINQQPYWGIMFRHDSDSRKGSANVSYPFTITSGGKYAVFISTTKPGGRSSQTPVTVEHAGGRATVRINQNALDNPFGLVAVGEFAFEPGKPATVTIGNEGTDSYVIYDVVRLVKRP